MKNDFELEMNDYLPLRDVVFETLRKAILKGKLKPGERLMELTLANKLGVSRTPIREAIRKLELEGLVVMIPRKGAQVAKITEKDLNDVLEVRRGLEELSISMACERITQKALEELEEASRDFEEAVKGGDVTALAEADVRFHDIIYSATDNRRLNQIVNNLREQMFRYRIEYLKEEDYRQQLVREHNAICKAIREQDFDRAKHLVCLHIDNQQQAIMESIKPKDEE